MRTTQVNQIYTRPDITDEVPCQLLASAVKVKRPNGTHVDMDLIALANITLQTERDLASLRATVIEQHDRIKELETENSRLQCVWKLLAGEHVTDAIDD